MSPTVVTPARRHVKAGRATRHRPHQDKDGRPGATFRASCLVGADGVRGSIRPAIAQPFPGHTILSSLILADVRLSESPDRPFVVNAVPNEFALLTEMSEGLYRANFGTAYGITEIPSMSRFHSDERQARPTASGGYSSPVTPRTRTPPRAPWA